LPGNGATVVVVEAVEVTVGEAIVAVVGTIVMAPDVIVVEASVVDAEDVPAADAPPSQLHAASTSVGPAMRAPDLTAGRDRCTGFMTGTT
jgi:hypothetical protein